jgi:hypothetical protein
MTRDSAGLSQVFASGFPYDEPFRPELGHRLVVGLILDELVPNQFEALAAAAKAVGDEAMLYAQVAQGEEESEHWPMTDIVGLSRFTFDDFDTYFHQPTASETKALWSPSAQWGLLITTDWFGLVAGVAEFHAAFRQTWPPWPPDPDRSDAIPVERQVESFVQAMCEEPLALERTLAHMYGPRQARELLETDDGALDGGR